MISTNYIDSEFQKVLDGITPAVKAEVGYSFDIAARIHEILQKKAWTQADLARATGKTAAEVSRWMSGTHNFTIRTIALIESATGEGIIGVKRFRSRSVSGYAAAQRPALYLNDENKSTD